VSWVARRRLAADDRELLDAMLTGTHSCIRCEAIDEHWIRETSDNQAVWLRGGQLAAITAAWSPDRLPDERLVEAFRWRDLVQARISVDHHGYVAYYQLAAGGQWRLLCRTGYWIA
jgi:hypothetical protein